MPIASAISLVLGADRASAIEAWASLAKPPMASDCDLRNGARLALMSLHQAGVVKRAHVDS